MAGFDEGGVFFSDNFASEEQNDENQINRQQVKKRLKDFIRQFHEGNFSYTYRYIFFSRSASISQSFPFLCCVQSKYRCQCITRLDSIWLYIFKRCLCFCLRDQLKRNYNLGQHWLDVEIEDVSSFDEALAEKLSKIPSEHLPLVCMKNYFNI